MACHVLFYKNEKEFFELVRNRDPELILKLVKCVLNAVKRKKEKIDVFDITFKENLQELVISLDKEKYLSTLETCLKDMEKQEEYELCSEIKKLLDKSSKKKAK